MNLYIYPYIYRAPYKTQENPGIHPCIKARKHKRVKVVAIGGPIGKSILQMGFYALINKCVCIRLLRIGEQRVGLVSELN